MINKTASPVSSSSPAEREELASALDRAHQACRDAGAELGKVHGLLTACSNRDDHIDRALTSAHRIADELENIARGLRSATEQSAS